nr:OpcA/G6PD domain-containing protein [Tessaracoccus coleopterorum]
MLAAWLKSRLQVPVSYVKGDYAGVNGVALNTAKGDITVRRIAEGAPSTRCRASRNARSRCAGAR